MFGGYGRGNISIVMVHTLVSFGHLNSVSSFMGAARFTDIMAKIPTYKLSYFYSVHIYVLVSLNCQLYIT